MGGENNKWAIIYNPHAGIQRLSRRRWREMREYIVSRHVKFEYSTTSGYGSAEPLARAYAERGFKTIVVVGGDGVLNDVVNGIMTASIKDTSQVSIGIVPNGIGNDFASFWGINDDYKEAIEYIIAGRTKKIDVGYCSYFHEKERVRRHFVNAMNFGLGAQITKITDKMKRFFAVKWLSYIAALFVIFFVRKIHRIHLVINDEHVRSRATSICVGNASGYKLTPNAVPYNGWLDVSIIRPLEFKQLAKGLWMMIRGQLLNHKGVRIFRTKNVKVLRVQNAIADTDGRIYTPDFPLEIGIEHEKLNMIIPNK